jgi:hypothetical protein
LVNGSCTDGTTGAFSGAALSSQALSGLSQTTTQATTGETQKAVEQRREEERRRVAAPVVPPAPPTTEVRERTAKVTRRHVRDRVVEEEVVKQRKPEVAARRRYRHAAPQAEVVQREQEPYPTLTMVRKGPEPVFLPAPVEPIIRYATWTQVYGDYEKRDATGSGGLLCCLNGAIAIGNLAGPPGLALSIQSRTGTVGFLAGADLTSRSLLSANDGLIVGLTAGYVSSTMTLNASSLSFQTAANPGGNGVARLNANLSGPTGGLYATYFNGGFSSDFMVKFDALTLNENFNDLLVTTASSAFVPIIGGGSVSLLNTTIASNLNYRFGLHPNLWIEPTVGAQYTNSSYGGGAAQLGLAEGNLVKLQGGARLGATTLINNHVLLTTTLTGLAYDDVLVSGGFIPVAASNGQNLLVQSDRGQVRGRGILAFNFDLGGGFASFLQGEVRGGAHLFGAGGKAGIRYQW